MTVKELFLFLVGGLHFILAGVVIPIWLQYIAFHPPYDWVLMEYANGEMGVGFGVIIAAAVVMIILTFLGACAIAESCELMKERGRKR